MRITSSKHLANAYRDQRKRKGITQSALAAQTTLKQSTISAFENQPDGTKLETLFRLLSALDLELHLTQKNTSQHIDYAKAYGWEHEW